MSNNWINIRFGIRHFQLGKRFSYISFDINPYHIEHKPETFISVYDFFGLI